MKILLTVAEAIAYQRDVYGQVAFGRDALYAIAKAERVPTVRNGRRKTLFPIASIDQLMQGL